MKKYISYTMLEPLHYFDYYYITLVNKLVAASSDIISGINYIAADHYER